MKIITFLVNMFLIIIKEFMAYNITVDGFPGGGFIKCLLIIYVYMFICTCIFMYVCVCICLCGRICVHMYTGIQISLIFLFY